MSMSIQSKMQLAYGSMVTTVLHMIILQGSVAAGDLNPLAMIGDSEFHFIFVWCQL